MTFNDCVFIESRNKYDNNMIAKKRLSMERKIKREFKLRARKKSRNPPNGKNGK